PPAVFVRHGATGAIKIAESASMVGEIRLVLLELPQRARYVETRAFVCDRDDRALRGQHRLDEKRSRRIAGIAVLIGVAERIPERNQQVDEQLRPWHRDEAVRQHDFQARKQIVAAVTAQPQASLDRRDARIGDVARRLDITARRLDVCEQRGTLPVQLDHELTPVFARMIWTWPRRPSREPGTSAPLRRAREMPMRRGFGRVPAPAR